MRSPQLREKSPCEQDLPSSLRVGRTWCPSSPDAACQQGEQSVSLPPVRFRYIDHDDDHGAHPTTRPNSWQSSRKPVLENIGKLSGFPGTFRVLRSAAFPGMRVHMHERSQSVSLFLASKRLCWPGLDLGLMEVEKEKVEGGADVTVVSEAFPDMRLLVSRLSPRAHTTPRENRNSKTPEIANTSSTYNEKTRRGEIGHASPCP